MLNTFFFQKSHRLWDNAEICGGERVATNEVTTWRMCWSWIGKATCTYAHAHAHAPEYPHARTDQYVILIAFPLQQ